MPHSKDKKSTIETPMSQAVFPTSIIYADRIINAGFGPGVSRLTLGMEMGAGDFAPTVTLILPTPALIDGLKSVLNAIQGQGHPEVKEGILKALDAFKEQLIALE